jgi:excinuclease UvrABC helicase subunit UvrB
MKKAMDETQRRRNKQQVHNEANNITPRSVMKPIVDILDTDAKIEESKGEYDAQPKMNLSKETSGISKPSLSKLMPTNTSNTPKRKSRIISTRSTVSISECKYRTLMSCSFK